jgi:transposase
MTNTTAAEGAVLKTDVLGRIRTPRERREKILDEFEGSGLSGRKFAELTGINYQTFATWAQKRRRERKQYPASPKSSAKSVSQLRWLEAVVEEKKLPRGSGPSVLVVHLPGGARMEIADATQAALAAALLRSLENKPALAC